MKIPTFDQLRAKLDIEWEKENAWRRKIPQHSFERGSLAIGMLLDNLEETVAHGDRSFVSNDNVEWGVMRDIPSGHFPGGGLLHYRGASYVSKTKADLYHGMPRINFRDAERHVHFNRPGRPHMVMNEYLIREFGMYTRMSAAMTRAAFYGVDANGNPVRQAWFNNRPEDKTVVVPSPREWMPKPVLGFSANNVEGLYAAATETKGTGYTSACPHCYRRYELSEFANKIRFSTVFNDNGDWIAVCPSCYRRGYYRHDEVQYSASRRKFSTTFKTEFCAAVADGLPLQAPTTWTYLGAVSQHEQVSEMRSAFPKMPLTVHSFKTEAGKVEVLYLPTGVAVEGKIGHVFDPDDVVTRVLRRPTRAWTSLPLVTQWQTLSDVCGGLDWVGFLQRLWFGSKGMRFKDKPDLTFYPVNLAGTAVHTFRPLDLWWDISAIAPYVSIELEAAVLPPIPLVEWDRLSFALPNDVLLDARISHPNFRQFAYKRNRKMLSPPPMTPKPSFNKVGGHQKQPKKFKWTGNPAAPVASV